ncbi:MAG: ribosome small subunit-dependent GTPase A [Johnsonella sp.]|nr:ribosome small subunit-dependent GTPase A [Johnsonella sp.]
MRGRIKKAIAGFFYVDHAEEIYECKAKGIFRNQEIKPLVGDEVEFTIVDEEKKTGNIFSILPRRNSLIRPALSNIDTVLVVISVAKPKPQLYLLDKYLVYIQSRGIVPAIIWNKADLEEEEPEYVGIYRRAGFDCLYISAICEEGIAALRQYLKGRTGAFAGPSGVGKSTLLNCLLPAAAMETGSISRKIERGKHTTRHSELFRIDRDTYVFDTPGFSSISLEHIDKSELWQYYPEFVDAAGECRFSLCSHISEPGCRIKKILGSEELSLLRYENYTKLYKELANIKQY